jgi:hypothetical protein
MEHDFFFNFVFLLIYLFNDTASSLEYIVSNTKIIANN